MSDIKACKCGNVPAVIYHKSLRKHGYESYGERNKRCYWGISCCNVQVKHTENKQIAIDVWNSLMMEHQSGGAG